MSEEEKEQIEKLMEYLRTSKSFMIAIRKEYKDKLVNYIDKLQKEIKNADERNYSLGLDFIQMGEKLGLENFGIQTILLEIDKLQKENELMKKELDKCSKHIIPCMLETSKDYISKDKIRDKIKEVEEQCKTELLTTWLEAKIEVLEELLEEE